MLVVDDNPDARQILKAILETRGFTVLQADNGEDAVASARRNRPDLIFMDLMMPVMDGWTAMELLRAESDEISQIPVVAVTAYEPPLEDIKRAGFCAFLRKPVAPLEAARAVMICLDARARGDEWIADLARQARRW